MMKMYALQNRTRITRNETYRQYNTIKKKNKMRQAAVLWSIHSMNLIDSDAQSLSSSNVRSWDDKRRRLKTRVETFRDFAYCCCSCGFWNVFVKCILPKRAFVRSFLRRHQIRIRISRVHPDFAFDFHRPAYVFSSGRQAARKRKDAEEQQKRNTKSQCARSLVNGFDIHPIPSKLWCNLFKIKSLCLSSQGGSKYLILGLSLFSSWR